MILNHTPSASPYNHIKVAKRLKAKDLLRMGSISGVLADLAPIGSSFNIAGESRAGRATAMAKAVGEDPGFFVNYPQTSSAILGLGGGILGAGAGIGAFSLIEPPNQTEAILSGLAGGLSGAFLGGGLAGLIRRNKMKDIVKAFDAAKKIKPVHHNAHALDLLGGLHNLNYARANEAMLGRMSPEQATDVSSSRIGLGLGVDAAATAALLGGIPSPVGIGALLQRISANSQARSYNKKTKD